MNIQTIASSGPVRLFFNAMGAVMESRLRYRFFGPVPLLQSAGLRPGQAVLEVGCGTGFFTVPAAQLIGEHGHLVALDILPAAIERVTQKVEAAGVKNVRLVNGDALNIGLEPQSVEVVLLFGVIPAPMLPLGRLLSELGRVLKPGGTLAVWPPLVGGLRDSIVQSGPFDYVGHANGVYTFRRR